MSATIGSIIGNSGFTALANGRGQTFQTPNPNDIVFDKAVVLLNDTSNTAYNFNASLFEWNGNSAGAILGQITGSYSGGAPELVTLDFQDVTLQSGRSYGFGLIPTSTSIPQQQIQMGSGYADGGYLSYINNTWTIGQNSDLYFTAYFNSAGGTGAGTTGITPLLLPTGNYDESTDIGIDLSGVFSGMGQFSILNPSQSGNTYVKPGKYGELRLGTNGQFEYLVNDDKLSEVNTGQNVVDEFPIMLTSPDGRQAAVSTYRVVIAGYNDQVNSVEVDDREIYIEGSGELFARGYSRDDIRQQVIVRGLAYGLPSGSRVIPQFRIQGKKGYQEKGYNEQTFRPILKATALDGYTAFTWSKVTDKKIFVRFTDASGQVVSNRITIPFNKKGMDTGNSLVRREADPIISGGLAHTGQPDILLSSSDHRHSSSYQLSVSENAQSFALKSVDADPFGTHPGGGGTLYFMDSSNSFV